MKITYHEPEEILVAHMPPTLKAKSDRYLIVDPDEDNQDADNQEFMYPIAIERPTEHPLTKMTVLRGVGGW